MCPTACVRPPTPTKGPTPYRHRSTGQPAAYSGVRANHFEAPEGIDWLDDYRDKLAVSPFEAAMPMVAK